MFYSIVCTEKGLSPTTDKILYIPCYTILVCELEDPRQESCSLANDAEHKSCLPVKRITTSYVNIKAHIKLKSFCLVTNCTIPIARFQSLKLFEKKIDDFMGEQS